MHPLRDVRVALPDASDQDETLRFLPRVRQCARAESEADGGLTRTVESGMSFDRYVEYVKAQITELLTGYGPIAGIWLDGAAVPRSGDWRRFRLTELYVTIHRLQPRTLISYKFGITGTEDFLAPERPQLKLIQDRGTKPMEMCIPLSPGWGYVRGEPHIGVEDVMKLEAEARQLGANLLVNVGPLGDGSIHGEDRETLRAFGKRIRSMKG